MRILMMCPYPLSSSLGGAKVYLENTQTYRELGHDVDLIGGDELTSVASGENHFLETYSNALFDYLKRNSESYDVVEYEYLYLPYRREYFPLKPLFVARAVLLELHLIKIKIPRFRTFRSFLGGIVKGSQRKCIFNKRINYARKTLGEADAISVANPLDKNILRDDGIDPYKVIVAPYGLTPEHFAALRTERQNDNKFKVAFVGTFDPRKGAVEFPSLWAKLIKEVPHAKLKLLGTSSMFPDAESVKNHFPSQLRRSIEVIEKFDHFELPQLLSDCNCGVFPSYLESFGFGVLEMMAASLPVAAYNAPGPEMLLPEKWLVGPGDHKLLAEKLIYWAKNKESLSSDQDQAFNLAQKFSWRDSCEKALAFYQSLVLEK